MQKRFETQPRMFVSSVDMEHPALQALDGAESVLNWHHLESLMEGIYGSGTGRPSYPLLTLFRSLLLGIWYNLSDVQLSSCLARDLLFRKFCRLELGSSIPDATTIGRFRQKLVEHDLWEILLGEVNRQLEEQHIIMTEGRINIIDATPIEAAQSGNGKDKNGKELQDPEAGWHVKENSRGKKTSTYGYSVHTGCDEDTFIHSQTVTSGEVHDSQGRDYLLLGNETKLYADSAYSSAETDEKLYRFGIDNQVQKKGVRGHPLCEKELARNAEIAVIRSGGERPFATYKRNYGLRRTRLMGLAKNTTFFGIAAIAHNIQKAAKFLKLYGIRQPITIG